MHVLIIDCETTGTGPNDVPVAIGSVLIRYSNSSAQIVSHLYQENSPSVPISKEAEAIHGLTSEYLLGKQFDIPTLVEAVEQADRIVSHNANFDARMIAKIVSQILHKTWHCTLNQYPWPDDGSKSLQRVCDTYSIPRSAKHNALDDCKALLSALGLNYSTSSDTRRFLDILLDGSAFELDLDIDQRRLIGQEGIAIDAFFRKTLMHCRIGTEIRLWTKPEMDFIIGYTLQNRYCESRDALCRLVKSQNKKLAKRLANGEYFYLRINEIQEHDYYLGYRDSP